MVFFFFLELVCGQIVSEMVLVGPFDFGSCRMKNEEGVSASF